MPRKEESQTITRSGEETKERHKRLLYAVNNPIRRRIMKLLKRGFSTIDELVSTTDLEVNEVKWHIDVLKRGYCVQEKIEAGKRILSLTKEGEVVDYLEE